MLHLFAGDVQQLSLPFSDQLELMVAARGVRELGELRFHRERGEQVLAHQHMLELRHFRQRVDQLGSIIDRSGFSPGHGASFSGEVLDFAHR
jgi:hypothetical protein